jgi:IS30 family transposase
MVKTSIVIFWKKQHNGGIMPQGYHHLTYDQRCQIYTLKRRGDSVAIIAKELGVNASSIYRELGRNTGQRGYRYKQADEMSIQRRKGASSQKRKMTDATIAVIREKLKLQWSPCQISGWLKKALEDTVSHEMIYQYIWADKRAGGALHQELRHHGKKYNKRSKGKAGRGCIPKRVDIDQRPAIVEEKTRLGDWEIDTIIGASQSGAIVSMVERASKLTKLAKITTKTAHEVEKALLDRLIPVKEFVHTLTSDNGKEFANHQKVSNSLEASFYFATPYHSWERGLNEHTNGLVRQYFPKSKCFNEISVQDLETIEILLNTRPRKVLKFSTPLEVFDRLSRQSLIFALQT